MGARIGFPVAALKKYVDERIATYTNFGNWAIKSNATVYEAASDGFVVVHYAGAADRTVFGYTDSSNPPTTVRNNFTTESIVGNKETSFTMPVRKNDFWKVTGDPSAIYWLPKGV